MSSLTSRRCIAGGIVPHAVVYVDERGNDTGPVKNTSPRLREFVALPPGASLRLVSARWGIAELLGSGRVDGHIRVAATGRSSPGFSPFTMKARGLEPVGTGANARPAKALIEAVPTGTNEGGYRFGTPARAGLAGTGVLVGHGHDRKCAP